MKTFFLKRVFYIICFFGANNFLFAGINNHLDTGEIRYNLLLNEGVIDTKALLKEKRLKYKALSETNNDCYEYLMYVYSNHYLMIEESLKSSYFIKGTPINAYLTELVSKIQESNAALLDRKGGYEVLIACSEESNAYSLGDGILVVTLGLIASVDNEKELTFVLCHELAHDALEHNEKSKMNYAIMHTSKEIDDSIDLLLEDDLYTVTRMENYLAKVYSEKMKKSRVNELAADSLGLIMLGKSGFQVNDAISALKKINDPILSRYRISIFDYLNSKNTKIKNNWYYKGDESRFRDIVYNGLFFMDTLPTHPEISFRIEKLGQMGDLPSSSLRSADSAAFKEIRVNSLIQVILNTYYSDDPASSVCYALVLKKMFPEQAFSDNMVVIGFCKAMFLKQQLRLTKCIGNSDSINSLSQNQVIHLMQKIRETEFNEFICPLMESVSERTESNIYSYTAVLFSGYFCFNHNKYNYLINNYKELYKNGFFKNDLIYLPKKKNL